MTNGAVEVPDRFYKYRSMDDTSIEWVERTVLHDEIYFAPAGSFNDPFDLRPVFSLNATPEHQREDFIRLSRVYEPHLIEAERNAEADRVMTNSLSPDNVDISAAIIQTLHNRVIREKVGVYCVSTKREDLLMWAHYADHHRGICLEFDGMLPLMAHAQKVQYSSTRIPINVYKDNNIVKMEKALLTKSEHWNYENEWRLIRYESGPGIAQFLPSNLKGIIIGALASPSTVATVRKWVHQRTTPIRSYRASVSNTKFELQIATDKTYGK